MKNTKSDIMFAAREDGGLLACVRAELKDMPTGKSKSYLEHRLISVDGVVTTQFNYPVKAGQIIKIRRSGGSTYSSPLEILYEDDDLLAVNKPAGLLSVASDTEKERTAFRMLSDSGAEAIYVVHRLDRDTSGVLLFAKSPEVRDALQREWDSTKKREYIAVCEGVFDKKVGRCDTVLRETAAHVVYSVRSGEGKRAITNYEVLRENPKYSYLRITIDTGRKNQIRVHMSEMGHPIVGDKKYGAKTDPLGRLGLHASSLEIIHPKTGAPLLIKAAAGRRFRLPAEKKKA